MYPESAKPKSAGLYPKATVGDVVMCLDCARKDWLLDEAITALTDLRRANCKVSCKQDHTQACQDMEQFIYHLIEGGSGDEV